MTDLLHVQHPCSATGCRGTALHPLNLCAACWSALPAALQVEVRRERSRGLRLKTHPTPHYRIALRRAVMALEARR